MIKVIQSIILSSLIVCGVAHAGYDDEKCDIYLSGDFDIIVPMIKSEFKKITGKEIFDEHDVMGIGYSMLCNEDFDNSKLLHVYGGK